MFHPEDSIIHKDILLESYKQAIEEGSLEMSLKPALDQLNSVPGVVTVGSCEGHPDRDIFCATVDLAVSTSKWHKMQRHIEELLPRDGGISAIEFRYGSLEDEIQQNVRIRTHPMLVKEKAIAPLTQLALKLVELTTPGFKTGDLVVMSAKRHPDDWPHSCAECGSRDIKVVFTELAGIKRPSWVECRACQDKEFRANTCPYCYDRMKFDGSRGGVYTLFKMPDTPGISRCPHCKHAFVRDGNKPVPIKVVEG